MGRKFVNIFRSHFLNLQASGYLGQQNYDKAIELGVHANTLNPNSFHILASLGHAYFCAGQYQQAREILHEAFECAPLEEQTIPFFEVLIRTLSHLDTPIEEMLPYLRRYLEIQSLQHVKFPRIMKVGLNLLAKIRGSTFNADNYACQVNQHTMDFYVWAYNTVAEYEGAPTSEAEDSQTT